MSEKSIFGRIADREIPATIVAETDRIIAFDDTSPKAPVHVIVTPKSDAYANVVELAETDPSLLAELVAVAHSVAKEKAGGDFRLVFNTGADAGQTVFHVHAHVLAGKLGESSLAE